MKKLIILLILTTVISLPSYSQGCIEVNENGDCIDWDNMATNQSSKADNQGADETQTLSKDKSGAKK